jgi:hypothetical protein
MQQQYQFDEKIRLLNISYFKIHKVKFNKLTKRAIEKPLNQSVIVWNFLKKVENLILETQKHDQLINNQTYATIEQSSSSQLMDVDNNYTSSSLSNKNYQNNKTNAIGSERKNKLLNKQNENEPPLAQQYQLNMLLKRSEFRTNDDLIVLSQPADRYNEIEDIMMLDENDNTFNLCSSSLSSEQQEYSYEQQLCSCKFIGQPLDLNIEYFDNNIIDKFEQEISMLIDFDMNECNFD